MSILRGDVRDAAGAAIISFNITDPDQATEYLLQDLTYIYPVDPFVRLFFPLLSTLTTYICLVPNNAEQPTIPAPGD